MSVERKPITGAWGCSPVWGLGTEPLVMGRGRGLSAAWSWNTFSFWTFNWSSKFVQFTFLKFWNAENYRYLCGLAKGPITPCPQFYMPLSRGFWGLHNYCLPTHSQQCAQFQTTPGIDREFLWNEWSSRQAENGITNYNSSSIWGKRFGELWSIDKKNLSS